MRQDGHGRSLPQAQRVNFDRIAHLYDETRTLQPDQMEAVVGGLTRALSSFEWVLEVGVGTGRIALPLQQQGVRVVGVDISTRMMARGREKGIQDVLRADALHLPFRDRAFEAAYSIHVLHLITEWEEALREVARVTRRSYYTVATYWEEPQWQRAPFRLYWDAVREAGYDRIRPGVFERHLPDHLPPAERVPLGAFEEERNVEEAIQRMQDRIYSGQWQIPDPVHHEAIEAVRSAVRENTQRFKKTVDLLRWRAEDLTGV